MIAPSAQLGAPTPAAAQPSRWFRHALPAPPQAVPDNLHGILAGGARGRLRALALALRRAAGPVAVLASAAAAPPCGIPIGDLDLRASALARDLPGAFRQPAWPAAALPGEGARRWRGWQAGLSVVIAAAGDAARVALLLDLALAEAQVLLRQRDAAVRTLVIDSELLVGPAQESALAIARSGRKANCSCLVLAGTEQLPGWSDHAGFTVCERAGALWLAIDQEYRIAIDGVVGAEELVRAHALLHPARQGG